MYGRKSKDRYFADKAPSTPPAKANGAGSPEDAHATNTPGGSMFGRFTSGLRRGTKSFDEGGVDARTGKKITKRAQTGPWL